MKNLFRNNIFKKIQKTDSVFFKSFFSAGIISCFKLLNGILIVKALATIGGVEGMPSGGNFLNVSQIFQILATAGISLGIIKYLSQNTKGSYIHSEYLSSAFFITLVFSSFSALGLFLASPFLSMYFYNSYSYFYLYVIMGFSVFLFGFNNFLISYYSAQQAFKDYLLLNGINSLLGFLFILLTLFLQNELLLYVSIAFYQTVGFFLVGIQRTYIIWKQQIQNLKKLYFNRIKKMLFFGYYTVQNIIVISISQIIVRNYIVTSEGLASAGLWEGIMRICSSYLGFFNLLLTLFFIPVFASSDLKDSIRLIIRKGGFLVLLLISLLILIYLFRNHLLNLILSKDFIKTEILMPGFFTGDVFRFAGYIISILYLSRGKLYVVVLSDILFNGIFFCILNYYFIKKQGLEGSGSAYLINYILYFFVLMFYLIWDKRTKIVNNEYNA
jgi:PST family polysaccharide transporter